MSLHDPENERLRKPLQRIGLAAGPATALILLLLLPERYAAADGAVVEFTRAGQVTFALLAWMAIWWMTETVDLAVTALLPLAVLPLAAGMPMTQVAAPYARPEIHLFLGGFLIALAMQRWRLDLRIALRTLSAVGTRPPAMIAGFMVATALLSAFVSNTATTAMMLPIALSVITLYDRAHDASDDSDLSSRARQTFARALLLGVAYAASIGGIATIIGSPPNVFLVGFMRSGIDPEYQVDISFAKWMMVGVPIALVMLPLAWLLLVRVLHRLPRDPIPGGSEMIQSRVRELGRITQPESLTLIVFFGAATLWMTRQPLNTFAPLAGLTDAGIAIIAAITLFLLPDGQGGRVMNWETARRAPFGILLLFGGGLSLAEAVQRNGVAEFFAAQAAHMGGLPIVLIILVVTIAVIFLTELTSNTATVATLVPILAAMAPMLGVTPLQIVVPATIAASCAFMMPVATPPNAIVFGSGRLRIADMCRAGFLLNLLGVVVVTVLAGVIASAFLG